MLAGLALLTRPHDGTPSLTAVGLLAPQLTDENHVQILDAARHKTKREVKPLAPERRPDRGGAFL